MRRHCSGVPRASVGDLSTPSAVVAATCRSKTFRDGLDRRADGGGVRRATHEGLDLVPDLGVDLGLPEPVEGRDRVLEHGQEFALHRVVDPGI